MKPANKDKTGVMIASVGRVNTLTVKEDSFVHFFVLTGEKRNSAIKAGYSPKTAGAYATELLKKPKVSRAIQERRAELAEETGITPEWILETLRKNCSRAMQLEPVLGRDGEPTGEYTYQGSVANRALELMGKEQGMFVERSESRSFSLTAKVDLKDYSLEDLKALIGKMETTDNGHNVEAEPTE